MKRRVTFERLVALVNGDRELVGRLIAEEIIADSGEGFRAQDVDRVLVSWTLLNELDVNWAGADIILRLREELAWARKRIAELEAQTGKSGRRRH